MTTDSSATWPSQPRCPVLELRQYTLRPGGRDVLIDLFEREFVETQEAYGMVLVGQFRDLDDPDRFVWVRGFADMDSRRAALAGFYGGPVWAAHRATANATMLDSDDVLLLRPVSPATGFPQPVAPRPAVGSADDSRSLVVATVYALPGPVTAQFLDFFDRRVEPLLAGRGSPRVALLETEPAENTFPALPVREGEHVVVRFSRFDGDADHADHIARLRATPEWPDVRRELENHLAGPPRRLRLRPTARSLLV